MRNQTGVAILSTDRPECLNRLLTSIDRYTPEKSVSIFVIDDSMYPDQTKNITCQYDWIKFIHTGNRIGIAKNTNEAFKVLSHYKYGMIMNNDMEILKLEWEKFYPLAMVQTRYHHFCFQQEGLWGAGTNKRPETRSMVYGRTIKTIDNHPQGALLAFDKRAFNTAGYFDAKMFKSYGKSHCMWSFSISESNIQPKGIHDVVGSNEFFKVHDEVCTTPNEERIESYNKNTKIFERELQKLRDGTRPIYTPLWEKNV
jgi:hypothetical protein